MEAESAAATATGGAAVVLPDTSGMDAIAHPGKVMTKSTSTCLLQLEIMNGSFLLNTNNKTREQKARE